VKSASETVGNSVRPKPYISYHRSHTVPL